MFLILIPTLSPGRASMRLSLCDSIDLMPKNGVGMHSSFNDPNTDSDAPPRESIEVRIICYWNPK